MSLRRSSSVRRKRELLWLCAVGVVVVLAVVAVRGLVRRPAPLGPRPAVPRPGSGLQPVTLLEVELSEGFDPRAGPVRPAAVFSSHARELVLSFRWATPVPATIACELRFEGKLLPDLRGSLPTGGRPAGRGLFRLRGPPKGWPPGNYEVALSASGVPLATRRFAVR